MSETKQPKVFTCITEYEHREAPPMLPIDACRDLCAFNRTVDCPDNCGTGYFVITSIKPILKELPVDDLLIAAEIVYNDADDRDETRYDDGSDDPVWEALRIAILKRKGGDTA
jgi:hypothetical protein